MLNLHKNKLNRASVVLHIAGLGPSMKQHSSADPISGLQSSSISSPVPVGGAKPESTSSATFGSAAHRIIWCLYVPEPGQDESSATTTSGDDASRIFVLCRKSRAHILNLDLVLALYETNAHKGPLNIDELTAGGHLVIDEHKSTILTASFSPDGSAIATASADGEIGFFKISFNDAATAVRSSSEGLSLMDKQVKRFILNPYSWYKIEHEKS